MLHLAAMLTGSGAPDELSTHSMHLTFIPLFPLQAGALPGHWPHVTLALGQGFNLTAFALSLLLVFRTNSSYDRWWEARKLWGGVVNRTRDVVRQVRAGRGAEVACSGAAHD